MLLFRNVAHVLNTLGNPRCGTYCTGYFKYFHGVLFRNSVFIAAKICLHIQVAWFNECLKGLIETRNVSRGAIFTGHIRQARFHDTALYFEVTAEDVGVIQKPENNPRSSVLIYS
jgi:hypothetical protein